MVIPIASGGHLARRAITLRNGQAGRLAGTCDNQPCQQRRRNVHLVECRRPGRLVGDPHGLPACRVGHPPGTLQVRVGRSRHAWDIRDEIRLGVALPTTGRAVGDEEDEGDQGESATDWFALSWFSVNDESDLGHRMTTTGTRVDGPSLFFRDSERSTLWGEADGTILQFTKCPDRANGLHFFQENSRKDWFPFAWANAVGFLIVPREITHYRGF